MRILLLIAFRNLRQAGRRTFILALALVVVTMSLTILLALSHGVLNNIKDSATILQSGHVNVAGFFKVTAGRGVPLVRDKSELIEIVRREVPEAEYIIDRHRGFAKVIGPTGSLQSALVGLDITNEPRLKDILTLAPESDYKEGGSDEVKGSFEALVADDAALIFTAQAKQLGAVIGDVLTISTETSAGAYNTTDVTIVAIAKDIGIMSDFNTFMNRASIVKLYSLAQDTTGAVMIYLDDPKKSKEVMERLRGVFDAEGYGIMEHLALPFFAKFDIVNGEDWTGQRLDLTIWEDEVSFFMNILLMLDVITGVLTIVLTVIIAIGIINAMYISVRERTSEIGTLRAIGMSGRRVLAMVLLEGVLMGLIATSAGALLGAGIALAVDAASIEMPSAAFRTILLSDTLRLSLMPLDMLRAVGTFTLVTALAALIPAFQAARLQPITAIQRK